MRDLLRRGADDVERPGLDIDHLVAAAERRLVRQRVTTAVAAAAAVAVVAVGGLTLGAEDGRESPAPPDVVDTPDTPVLGDPTYFNAPSDADGDPLRGWFATQGASDVYLRHGLEPPRRVIATDADERCATVSPDGARLAYLRGPYHPNEDPAPADVVVVPLDSAGDPQLDSQQVVLRDAMSCAQWSPDGRRLAAVTEGTDWTSTELHLVTLDGNDRRLAVLPPYKDRFAWSPDGDAIAYLTEDAVWIAAVDGAEPELFWRSTPTPDTEPQGVPLARAPKSVWWPSPGTLAVQVYSSDVDAWPYVPEGPDVMHIIDVGSKSHVKVELGAPEDGIIAWSPDGSKFAVADIDGSQIMVYDRAARSTVTLLPRLERGRRLTINGVAWSADGRQLLTDAQRGPDSEGGPFALVSVPLDGGAVEVLTPWTKVERR
jgi:hypothetical protein